MLVDVNSIYFFFGHVTQGHKNHSRKAQFPTVQQEKGSWTSSLGSSAAAGHPEGQCWVPGDSAPSPFPSVCPGSNPAHASGKQRAGSCGREGTLERDFGAHLEELLL